MKPVVNSVIDPTSATLQDCESSSAGATAALGVLFTLALIVAVILGFFAWKYRKGSESANACKTFYSLLDLVTLCT